MNELVKPIIHMNGDRPEVLREQYVAALRALNAANDALSECLPNARNYYPVEGLWDKARAQHAERKRKIDQIASEIEALAVHCDRHAKD